MEQLVAMMEKAAGTAPATEFAAVAGRMDDSGIFVWIFLGFCALIVLLQTIPAILLMTGLVKGMASLVSNKIKTVVRKA